MLEKGFVSADALSSIIAAGLPAPAFDGAFEPYPASAPKAASDATEAARVSLEAFDGLGLWSETRRLIDFGARCLQEFDAE